MTPNLEESMTDLESYLAAASRIAAGICAGKPQLPFGMRPDAANDLIARCACEIADRLLLRAHERYRPTLPLGVPAAGREHMAEDLGTTE
jgi:hypothetical protein